MQQARQRLQQARQRWQEQWILQKQQASQRQQEWIKQEEQKNDSQFPKKVQEELVIHVDNKGSSESRQLQSSPLEHETTKKIGTEGASSSGEVSWQAKSQQELSGSSPSQDTLSSVPDDGRFEGERPAAETEEQEQRDRQNGAGKSRRTQPPLPTILEDYPYLDAHTSGSRGSEELQAEVSQGEQSRMGGQDYQPQYTQEELSGSERRAIKGQDEDSYPLSPKRSRWSLNFLRQWVLGRGRDGSRSGSTCCDDG